MHYGIQYLIISICNSCNALKYIIIMTISDTRQYVYIKIQLLQDVNTNANIQACELKLYIGLIQNYTRHAFNIIGQKHLLKKLP